MTAPAREQVWTADSYKKNARFVSDLGSAVLGWLAPKPGESILDLGCGDGALTQKIFATGANVLGVDLSESLLERARERGLEVREMDGEALDFSGEFDAVFTNAALHWMLKPQKVVDGVRRALKPGGRFVGEFGGHGNVAAVITAMRAAARIHGGDGELAGPWFYPTMDEFSEILVQGGFAVTRMALIPRPTPLPTGLVGWLTTFRKPFFDQYDAELREKVLQDVAELLRPSLCDTTGRWTADYVRLRFEAKVGK